MAVRFEKEERSEPVFFGKTCLTTIIRNAIIVRVR
jgi:hypothetical protein